MDEKPLYAELLSAARRLARPPGRRPSGGECRRAISTAYYALFHFLASEATCHVLGRGPDRERLRDQLARGFRHREMFDACTRFADGYVALPEQVQRAVADIEIPEPLQRVARHFVHLQGERLSADYDRRADMQPQDAIIATERAEDAIFALRSIDDHVATDFFLASLLTWRRIRSG